MRYPVCSYYLFYILHSLVSVGSFNFGWSKFIQSLSKIEHTSTKLLNFENRPMPGPRKVPKLYFQSQFLCQKPTVFFSLFHLKRRPFNFVIFFSNSIFQIFYFLILFMPNFFDRHQVYSQKFPWSFKKSN